MALFNIRWPGRAAQADGKRSARSRPAVTTESVDALRRRARHRLIGAAVLLVAGVVGFPVLFDTQPRPIPVDIPIAVPERGQAPSVVAPSHPVASAPAAPAPAPSAPATVAAKPPAGSTAGSGNSPASTTNTAGTTATTADSLDKGEEVVSAAAPRPEKPVATPVPPKAPVKPAEPAHETARAEARREAAAAAATAAAAAAKPVTPPAAATAARDDDAARARALLDGQPMPAASAAAPAATDAGRFVVQVGAFGDAAKAQEARAKLTRGGLKTYVQQVDTKDGKRIRVRVGPFANKAEADRAAAKVKGLDLPASILVL